LEGCLRGRFARSFYQVVLGGSGDNPPDLLHNSNKPSNAVRPRGLGGTPIKKNHPKRRKLRFYPPCISYPRPLVESVAFFYIPDPLREPPCVKKKSRGLKSIVTCTPCSLPGVFRTRLDASRRLSY
jgi:hypothetical protein